jgi:hypothetical protein
MRMSRASIVGGGALLLVMALATGVIAGTVSNNGLTLTFPDHPLSGPALESCEPWEEASANTVTVTGVPEGATVTLTFLWSNPYAGTPNYLPPATYANVTGGTLTAPVSYPLDSSQWPLWDDTSNERAIAVAVLARVTSVTGAPVAKLVSKQWWIRCLPPPRPAEGCTPGYWKQDHHFDSWVGHTPAEDFEVVFGVDASFSPHTLLDALERNGGGENALARHATAALLNISSGLNYSLGFSELVAAVQNAYATGTFEALKDRLDAANNAGCPLN